MQTESISTSADAPLSSNAARLRIVAPLLLVAVCLALGAALYVTQVGLPSTPTLQQRMGQTGLNYARREMPWEKGPKVQSSRIIPLSRLASAVKTLRPPVRDDMSASIVSGLVRTYGAKQKIAFVVLFGKFNTLPPGEGVDVSEQVLVLVNMKTRRGIFLDD